MIQKGISYIYQIEEVQRVYEYDKITVYQNLQSMLDKMKEIDIRGSFESDDEVGAVFTELKNLIEEYNKTINQ